MRQLAWSAYERAIELGHPKKKFLKTRQGWLSGYIADADPLELVHPDELREVGQEDPLLGDSDDIRKVYDQERKAAKKMQAEYAKWERQKIEGGLPIWSRAGLKELYGEMNRRRRRCKAPSVIEDPQAPAQRTEKAARPGTGTKKGTEK
jgi:hypothetical protein